MFCSATPALTKRSGNRATNLSKTPKPRSPVTSMMRSSLVASSHRVAKNASRMGHFRGDRQGRLGAIELRQRRGKFLALRRAVVPEHALLHEGHTLPLHCVRQHEARLAALER